MDWTLEVVVVPVSSQDGGVDRAIAFYRDQLGFNLDHHTQARGMNFAQLTPPGSGCSIVIGDLPGGPSMEPGSLKGLQLVVADTARAHHELSARGVLVGDINVIDERDGGTMFDFSDPDGNAWVVQQIKAREHTPLIAR